jgi:hypothetical protein
MHKKNLIYKKKVPRSNNFMKILILKLTSIQRSQKLMICWIPKSGNFNFNIQIKNLMEKEFCIFIILIIELKKMIIPKPKYF